MVAQRSTRSAIHDPRDKRLGKLRRKRQQLTLGIAFVLTLIVVAIGLKITGLLNLGSGVAEAQAIESQVDERNDSLEANTNLPQPQETVPAVAIVSEEIKESEPVQEVEVALVTAEPPSEEVMQTLPTQAHLIRYEENAPILYYAQSGTASAYWRFALVLKLLRSPPLRHCQKKVYSRRSVIADPKSAWADQLKSKTLP